MRKCNYCHGDLKTTHVNQVVLRIGKTRRRSIWCPVCNWDRLIPSEQTKYQSIRDKHTSPLKTRKM